MVRSPEQTMKAVVYHGKYDVRYHNDYPEPQLIDRNDVKLKVAYCGICGSDLKEYTSGPFFFNKPGKTNPISNLQYPMVLGHEISAQVVAVGENVTEFAVGNSVVVEVTGTCKDKFKYEDSPKLNDPYCGACFDGHYNACDNLALTGLGFSDGGCAEYLVTTKDKLIKFDSTKIPLDVAALIQPLAVSWHAVNVSRFKPGDSALILGCGPIGLTTIFALKGHNPGKIIVSEPALARRLLAEKLQVEVFDPNGKLVDECVEELKKLSPNGYGFHHIFDCSGVLATFNISIKCLRIRGTATNVAVWAKKFIDYSPMETTMSEKIMTGSICFVKSDFEQVVKAIEDELISVDELKLLITDKILLENSVEHGFKELLNHKDRHIKMLFTPFEEYLE